MSNKDKALALAMEGNKNGLKLKDLNIRKLAFEQYLEHLAKGKSKKSFVFEHPALSCTYVTIEKYMKDTAEFSPLQVEMAIAKGYAYWESVVQDSATGKNQKANTASLQMLMRNKYDWDKPVDKQQNFAPEALKAFEMVMTQVRLSQEQLS